MSRVDEIYNATFGKKENTNTKKRKSVDEIYNATFGTPKETTDSIVPQAQQLQTPVSPTKSPIVTPSFESQVADLESQQKAKAKEVSSYMSGTPEWNKATQELQGIYNQLNSIKTNNYLAKNEANKALMGDQYDVVKNQLALEEQKNQLNSQMNGMGISSAKAYEQIQNVNNQINQLPKVTVGDVDMAKEYAQRELNAQNTQKMIDNAYGYANQGGLKGVNATLGSVGTNLISGAGGAYALGNAIANNRRSAEDYVPIDTNNNAFKMTNLTNALRQGVSDSIANKVKDKTILGYSGTATGDQPLGVWAYNIGTEILDNTARFLVAKGIGKIASANGVTDVAKLRKLSGKVANALMSSQVASSTMISNLEKGYSQEDALMLAYISAGIEGLTEEISVETLLNNPNHWVGRAVDKRIKNPTTNKLAKAFVSEGLEEVESNFGNRVAYTLINAKNNGIDENNLRQVYAELLKDSSSKEEAFAKLLLQLAKEDASSFLAGAISGLGMGASEAISTNRYYANIGKQERAKASGNSTAQSYVDFAKNSEDNTYLSELANKPVEKLSNAQLGYLMEESGKEVYKNKVKEQAKAEGITDEKLVNALALQEVGDEISRRDQRRIDDYNKAKELETNETKANEVKANETSKKNTKVVEENTNEVSKPATEIIIEKAQESFKADVKDLKVKYASSMAKTIVDAVNSNKKNKFSIYTKDFDELAKNDKRFVSGLIGVQIGNDIFYNSKASESEISPNVLGHEIGEQLKYTKVYKDEIIPMAIEYYGGKENVKRVIEEKKKLHSINTKQTINDEIAMYEITNDFLGDMMLHSNKFIDMLKGKDTTISGISKIIKSIKSKMNGKVDSIEKLENAFDKALQERNAMNLEDADMHFDEKSESINPSYSLATWMSSDYIYNIDEVAKEMSSVIGCSVKKAKDYIKSVNSIAKIIANDRTRLDYESSPDRSSFVSNVEYGGSFDFSTICKKRRLFTGTFEAIQKELKNTPLTSDEMLKIRDMMKKKGYEVSCGLCYVEGSRTNMGEIAKQFIERYKRDNPKYLPTIADVTTPNGQEYLRLQHPEAYETLVRFLNNKGKLKAGDSALFSSQAKPKMYQLATEYNGEVLKYFSKDKSVEEKNKNGGLRIQSFSDFEIIHLIDMMQVIMDMSRVGLGGQAYTKVPNFAWALGDTGLKINLSMIAKGVDENGKIIFDEVEGMKWKDAEALRNKYSDNVGTILVVFNNKQLKSAMMDDRIDYIIPFHRSQWNKNQFEKMGLPEGTKDYQPYQNEKWVKPKFKLNKNGELVKDKIGNYGNFMPNKYWDFKKSGRENAQIYLDMCAKEGRVPKFARIPNDTKSGGMDFLVKNVDKNGNVSYSLPNEKWADGYWKLLIDFKMYNNEGKGVPQQAVVPNFNMEEATRMLNEYKGLKEYDNADNENVGYEGEYEKFPVAQDVVDEFLKNKNSNVEKYKKDFLKPSYSDATIDIEGNKLSKEQVEFFKDSKMKDDFGHLVVFRHGTTNGGFSIFDPKASDDKTSLFFAMEKRLAMSYNRDSDEELGTEENLSKPLKVSDSIVKTFEDAKKILEDNGYKISTAFYENNYGRNDEYHIVTFPDRTRMSEPLYKIKRLALYELERKTNGIYSVYLNIKNPFVLDAQGLNWNQLSPEMFYNKDEGLEDINVNGEYATINGFPFSFGIYYPYANKIIKTFKMNEWDGEDFGKLENLVSPMVWGEMESGNYIPFSFDKNGKPFISEQEIDFLKELDKEYKFDFPINPQDWSVKIDNQVEWLPKDKIKRPLSESNLEQFEELWDGHKTRDISIWAKNNGFDGVVLHNVTDSGGKGRHFFEPTTVAIAFDSNQVKSIYNKNPTSNPDIRYSDVEITSNISSLTGGKADVGVYINDSGIKYTDLILKGKKTIETRATDSLKPLFKNSDTRRVAIIRSGVGSPQIVGYATLHKGFKYETETEFDKDNKKHFVPSRNDGEKYPKSIEKYQWNGSKYGYEITDVERTNPIDVPKATHPSAYRYSDAMIGDAELSSNTAYYNARIEQDAEKLRDQAIDNAYASIKSLTEDLKQNVKDGTVENIDYKMLEDAYKEVIRLEKQKAKDDQKLKDMDKSERKEYQDFWKEELNKADAKLDKEVAKLKAKEIVDKYQEQIKNARERRKRSQESQQLLRALKQLKAMRKKASPDFQAQIDDIIGDINLFGTNVLKNGYTRNDGVVVRGELDLQNLLKELELKEQDVNFINDKSYKEYKSWVERFNKKQIGDMPLEEIEKLLESATTLRHQILTYNQTVGETQDRLMSFIAHNVANEVESSKARRIGNATNFSIDTLRPKTFFKQLGGFSNGSLEGMYQELENGQTKFIDFTMKATKPFDDFVERNPEVKKWGGRDADLIEVQLGDKKVKINKMMRISLYMHLQNDDNMKHIVNGGIRVPDMKLYNEGNIKEAYARGIVVKPTKEVLIDLVSNMSPKELEFADLMKKHFKNASVEINNTSMALDGYEKATVDNYYPIHSDPTFLTTNFESIVRDFRLENTGSLKAREGGANPIILEDANNVLTRQIDTIGKYVGYAVPLRNFNTLYNFHIGGGDTVKGIINKKSTQYGKYIEHLIAQINGNNGKTSDFSKFSGNYASAVLNFNISVALSQTASYPTAMAVLGEKALRKGLTMGKVDTEIMAKYTPLYWYRTKGYIDNSLSAVKNASSWIQKLPGTKWIQAMDLLTTRTLWNASQVWVQDNTNLKEGTDAYWQKVAEMYNRTIYDTQPNYTVMQRPEVLRSDSELVRQLFMFKTQSYQNYNMLYESLGEMIAKKGTAQEGQARKQAFVTASTLLIANAVFTAFKNLVKMARNKKDEDWFDEDGDLRILKWLMDNYFSNALGSIPLGSEVFEAINFNNASYDTFTIPAVEVINSMISAYQVFESDIVKAISSGSPIVYFRQNRAKMMKDIWSLSKKISQFAGIPLDNVAKYIGGIVSWFMPEVTKAINNTINPVKKNDIAFSYEFDLLMKNELGFTNDKLYNLYQKAGDMVLPSFDVSNSSYGLTITQQYDVKEDYKKNVKSIFNTMFNMQGFKSLNSDQQAHCVVNAYSYAKEMALSKVNKDYPKTKWIKEAKSSPSSYIINKNKTYKK